AHPALFPLVVFKQVALSIEQGNASFSATAYASYGLILVAFLGDVQLGSQFGQLAIDLLDKIEATDLQAKTVSITNTFVRHHQEALRTCLQPLREGYISGIDTGDIEWAAWCAFPYGMYSYLAGKELTELAPEMETYSTAIANLKQMTPHQYLATYYQSVLNLLGESEVPYRLIGRAYDETVMGFKHQQENDRPAMYHLHINQAMLSYLFGEYEQTLTAIEGCQTYIDGVPGLYIIALLYFYDSLAQLALYHTLERSQQTQAMQRVEKNLAQLEPWVSHAPMNHEHKQTLIEAERCRVMAQRATAIDLYERAIAGAKEHDYVQEEALANELAAKFYLDWGKEKIAAVYMQEAYYCYSRWGAAAKVADLENRYPELLRPILQPSVSSVDALTTLLTITAPPTATIHSGTSHASSSTSLNPTLDFASVIKASQSLAGTIELNELLQQFTQIILQNSGGDRFALLLVDESGEWQVCAKATTHETQLCSEPLTNAPDLPIKLLQYVKNTQTIIAIDELDTDLPIIDDYLIQHQPKSILGLPILNQGHLIGLLYLQNNLVSGAFTTDRVLVLNFLCAQAAISLENARLYQKAQRYAKQIEESQLQIVQNEKMATLGNLVAGVAHEINNPMGFLNGSIQNGEDYVSDLFEYIETYQQKQPPNDEMVELAEELDLDFLQADLPRLLKSMRAATDRIKGISTSLRNFSRADTERKVSANLHDGLDSTLLILKYRLKANEHRPAIEVLQDYGELPEINCFPGQLNQVFMNILANAIDMFDEMAQQTTFEALEEAPQVITIQTKKMESNAVEVYISDNGRGMPDEVRSRIFDHLFTTKGVGKGTGLGLAIARQIIEETHGGALIVSSEVGEGTEFFIQLPTE
ncbi:MAG: ATP-binding protein, partial [Cyanobacteria bacterium P01_D01_bin.105]